MKKTTLIIIAAIVGVLGIGAYLLLNDDENGDSSTDTNIEARQESTTEDTSTTAESAELDGSYAVSLDELGVSFAVPNEIEEVENITVYRRFPNPSACEYVGQQAQTLLVLASQTGSDCVDLDEFSDSGTRTVQLDGAEVVLTAYVLGGNSGDSLLAEQTELDNNTTISFLYKEQFSQQVEESIVSILNSFRVDTPQ